MELNGIANLKILLDDIRQGAEILNDSSTNEIVKKALKQDLDALNKEIKYLHQYLKAIGKRIEHCNNVNMHQVIVPYWHEIKAKVDQNEKK